MPIKIAAQTQRMAAHPEHSSWVAASAGSGKTKVLTDRVLNLLLEGCPPERILCLTFTKAAAAEMANRVRTSLGEWAILSKSELYKTLETLQGSPPTPDKIERASRLFGLTLDTPGGLKIQTIHSFCESLLKRFPLEAGLSPFFEVMDDTDRFTLLEKASHQVMEDPALVQDLKALVLRFSELTFKEFNSFILQERASFPSLKLDRIDSIFQTENLDEDGLVKSLLSGIPDDDLRNAIPYLLEGSSTDQERGQGIARFLEQFPLREISPRRHCERSEAISGSPLLAMTAGKEAPRNDASGFDDYLSLFLTQKGEKRAHLITQKVALKSPFVKDLLEEEGSRLETWIQRRNALEIATVSKALFRYSVVFLNVYESLKKARSLLDYEDLILKTVELLKNPGCHWVLYKLDGGLDHILLDEAQDTSPSQWQVIRAIAEEFYANAATDPRNRTLFIVGDGKQSIYSFQGADPTVFSQMQKDLRTFAQLSGKSWKDIDLTVSFRSTPEVLTVVDAVFEACPLSESSVDHLPFRKEAPGHVEVWPLITDEEETSLESWTPPLSEQRKDPPQKQLALLIAKTIQGWLQANTASPGDILILVRRRTAFVDALIRTLKDHNVPVAGIDRLWLLEGIAVQDLLKIAEFLLLPEDDLTLATVLKGPLFNLHEDNLYELAHGRGKTSLWKRLQSHTKFKDEMGFLKDLLSKVDYLTPFELFSLILGPLGGRKKWYGRLGPEVLDSLDEFLNLCLKFQSENIPSLQGFLYWVSFEIIELKRDLDQSNQVRVMTVHGSKGLQAPIVFLPDTTQAPVDLPSIGIYDNILAWLPPAAKDIPLTKMMKQTLREKQQEEYKRLLYVALTRAEDALYICGWGERKPETWYDYVTLGLKKVGEEAEFDFSSMIDLKGKGWRLSAQETSLQGGSPPIVIASPRSERGNLQIVSSSSAPRNDDRGVLTSLPQWLTTPPLKEVQPDILRPSEDVGEETYDVSTYGDFATQRGILMHRLLEILPVIGEDSRERSALAFLKKEDVPLTIAQEMTQRVLGVFKAFPDLFGPQSQGEVPIMGSLGESLLSGQIDRLVMAEDHILIVDYKTHTHPPVKRQDIPQTYLKQMAIYKEALSQIYPEKTILCGLLWTEILRLDLLEESGENQPSITQKVVVRPPLLLRSS